ncbi:hypothetical protein GJ744_011092 [Endocarpon pusillum]|uniref:Sec20 C-terminal domain-containing protein n=1 Tax=Endocarpon pusillum TaxID=364733 RepID=A0A8H7AH42_9EURO|nr:hypothetical protein GJ744_011092 [Endocarpon pusillum]
MASQSLSARLQTVTDTYKTTLILIQRLQKLPYTPGAFSNADTDPRLELSSEIHQSLKEQEDELETLRQEVDHATTSNFMGGYVGGGSVRRRNSEQLREREKIAALVAKLGEDLKIARSSFRKAQLEAKRNADAARRKERELLFANRSKDADGPLPARRKGQEKLTQDELALNASSDVTAALRRTHALLQSNVEQSQFAQQTLNESTDALASLGESYAGLDSLLKSSGGLVRQLIRSNKSDTWYLTTAFYILVVTIGWLVFRRIFYGPLWWLVWQPMRLVWWLAMTTLAGVGIVGGEKAAALSSTVVRGSTTLLGAHGMRPTWASDKPPAYVPVGAKGGGWGIPQPHETIEADSRKGGKSMVDQIGERTDENDVQKDKEGTVIKGRTENDPPNPKKRMYEQENERTPQKRDEL